MEDLSSTIDDILKGSGLNGSLNSLPEPFVQTRADAESSPVVNLFQTAVSVETLDRSAETLDRSREDQDESLRTLLFEDPADSRLFPDDSPVESEEEEEGEEEEGEEEKEVVEETPSPPPNSSGGELSSSLSDLRQFVKESEDLFENMDLTEPMVDRSSSIDDLDDKSKLPSAFAQRLASAFNRKHLLAADDPHSTPIFKDDPILFSAESVDQNDHFLAERAPSPSPREIEHCGLVPGWAGTEHPPPPLKQRSAELFGLFDKGEDEGEGSKRSELFKNLDSRPAAVLSPSGGVVVNGAVVGGAEDDSRSIRLEGTAAEWKEAQQRFNTRIHRPQAASVLRSMNHFVEAVLGEKRTFFQGAPDRLASQLSSYLQQLEAVMERSPLWKGSLLSQTFECIEEYLMERVVFLAFVSDPRDPVLAERIAMMNAFLLPQHLGIADSKCPNEVVLTLASTELKRIVSAPTPTLKMRCVLRACDILFSSLNLSRSKGDKPGMDDFLPVLIFIVIRAAVPDLCAHLSFIGNFLSRSDMVGRCGYHLVNMESVVHFILTATREMLVLDEQALEHWVDPPSDQ